MVSYWSSGYTYSLSLPWQEDSPFESSNIMHAMPLTSNKITMENQEKEELLAREESSDIFVDIKQEKDLTSEIYETTKYETTDGSNFLMMDIYDSYDDENFHAFAKRRLQEISQLWYCNTVTYVFLSVFVIVSSITFTLVVLLLLVPYIRMAHFEESLCNVTVTTEHITESLCSCEEDCDFMIPCLLIEVIYKDAETQSLHDATIYDNELLLDLMVILFSVVNYMLNISFCETLSLFVFLRD